MSEKEKLNAILYPPFITMHQEFNNMPLFVLRIADDGAAKADGRLSVGDQIIEINGVTTHLMTHAQVTRKMF